MRCDGEDENLPSSTETQQNPPRFKRRTKGDARLPMRKWAAAESDRESGRAGRYPARPTPPLFIQPLGQDECAARQSLSSQSGLTVNGHL